MFFFLPQMPSMAATDNDYENEMASFEFSDMKKAKLSDSSIQRVTPDSGIALNYQSSVSSVGSLSPPIEKAAGEEMSKTFQSYDGGQVAVPDMLDLHKKSPLPNESSLSTARSATISSYSAANSPSSSPNTPTVSGKGTIPLSHAPGSINMHTQNSSLMYGASQMPMASPSMIHSSPMSHSPAQGLNTAFPFNPTPHHYAMQTHHPPTQSFHPFTISPHQAPPPPPMFSPANAYTHSSHSIPSYANSQSVFPQYSPQQHIASPYRAYPQSPVASQHRPYSHYTPSQSSFINKSDVAVSIPPALIPNGSPAAAAQLPSPPSPNLGTSASTPTEQEEEDSLPPLIKLAADQDTYSNSVSSPPISMETSEIKVENIEEEQQFFSKR